MDELKVMLKAVRDLQNSDPDTLVEAINGLIEAVIATGARLAYLNTWLESRGLSLDWNGKMTDARFIAIDDDRGEDYIAGTYIDKESRWVGDIRWDHATPEQRAQALQIEAERAAK